MVVRVTKRPDCFSFVDLVVRVQFYAIEIARNREGANASLRQVYGSKNV